MTELCVLVDPKECVPHLQKEKEGDHKLKCILNTLTLYAVTVEEIRFQLANPLVELFPFPAISLNASTLSLCFLRATWLPYHRSRDIPPSAVIFVMSNLSGVKRGAPKTSCTPRSSAGSCAASDASCRRRSTQEKHLSPPRTLCPDTTPIHHPTGYYCSKRQWYWVSMQCYVMEPFANSHGPNSPWSTRRAANAPLPRSARAASACHLMWRSGFCSHSPPSIRYPTELAPLFSATYVTFPRRWWSTARSARLHYCYGMGH